jgi:GH24 family phage-related lysozyme (muramidase)
MTRPIILPNPALGMADAHLSATLGNAKQTLYAEYRQTRSAQWFRKDQDWIAERMRLLALIAYVKEVSPMPENIPPPPPGMPQAPVPARMNWTTDASLLAFMRSVEGYRTRAYQDTKGITSIGIGRNIGTRDMTDAEVLYLYGNDVDGVCLQMDSAIGWWRKLNPDGQRAMISLCFMGWNTFRQFVHFLAAMEQIAGGITDPETLNNVIAVAHAELQASAWWNEVGQRGPMTLELIHA